MEQRRRTLAEDRRYKRFALCMLEFIIYIAVIGLDSAVPQAQGVAPIGVLIALWIALCRVGRAANAL